MYRGCQNLKLFTKYMIELDVHLLVADGIERLFVGAGIDYGALGARVPGPPRIKPPPPPQERSCFENNESKFGQITTNIFASKNKYFFMRQPSPGPDTPEWWNTNRYIQRLTPWQRILDVMFSSFVTVLLGICGHCLGELLISLGSRQIHHLQNFE